MSDKTFDDIKTLISGDKLKNIDNEIFELTEVVIEDTQIDDGLKSTKNDRLSWLSVKENNISNLSKDEFVVPHEIIREEITKWLNKNLPRIVEAEVEKLVQKIANSKNNTNK